MPRPGVFEMSPRAARKQSAEESAIIGVDGQRPRRTAHHRRLQGDECPWQHEFPPHEPGSSCRPSEFAAPQVRRRTRFRRATRGVARQGVRQ